MPSRPSPPSSAATSVGNSARSNHPSMPGRTRSRTQSRAASRIIRSSSVSCASPARWDISDEKQRDPELEVEGGDVSYGRYLRVPELLSLQRPLSEPLAH